MGWRSFFSRRKTSSPRRELFIAAAQPVSNRRRSHRVAAFLPVFVYGHTREEPFTEHTVTLNISANGGLLSLSNEVTPSQELLMANLQTDEELPCRIARVLKTQAGTTLVGFEFLRPAPDFWSIEFTS